MILGITGSIGSGKTTAANLFKKYGFSVINADEISHQIMKKYSVAYKNIVKNFGNEILGKDMNIDRKKLGNIVFNDSKKLKKLNSIMHPLIIKEIKNKIKKMQKKYKNCAKIIIDAPLLIEADADSLVDKVVVVKAFHKNVITRNKKFSMEQLEKIALTQLPLYEKLKKANFMVDNTKDLKHLEKQVREIIKTINLKTI